MMRIDIITCLPEVFDSPLNQSIVRRAQDKNLVEIHVHNLRDYSSNKYRQVDDYQYGGGAGMVLMIEPIDKCIAALKSQRSYDEIIYLSPDGELLNQGMANSLSLNKNLIMLCGHYKGVDERVRQKLITKEISVGNYVLSGGELGALILSDAVIRLLPGVLSDETSALSDSFQDNMIAPPVFTRPSNYKGLEVPEILLSGHAAKIENWRHEQSLQRTKDRRPELLKGGEN